MLLSRGLVTVVVSCFVCFFYTNFSPSFLHPFFLTQGSSIMDWGNITDFEWPNSTFTSIMDSYEEIPASPSDTASAKEEALAWSLTEQELT